MRIMTDSGALYSPAQAKEIGLDVACLQVVVNDKSYIFKEDIDERNLISYDSEGNEYYPIEVSIEIFNMLVEGVIKMGYLKTIEENEI